nr:hypothetical protein [Acidocella sp.]
MVSQHNRHLVVIALDEAPREALPADPFDTPVAAEAGDDDIADV